MYLLRSWSLMSTGTHHAKRCEVPASLGKPVLFRKVRKSFRRSWVLQKGFLKAETRGVAVRPKQSRRCPQGGGEGPKQCPGDSQRLWT